MSIRQILRLHGRTHRPGGSDPTGGIFYGAENHDSTQYPGLYVEADQGVNITSVNNGDGAPDASTGTWGIALEDGSSDGLLIGSSTLVTVNSLGEVDLSAYNASVRLDLTSSGVVVRLSTGKTFTVENSTGNPIFRVDEDGDIHILTGETISADL